MPDKGKRAVARARYAVRDFPRFRRILRQLVSEAGSKAELARRLRYSRPRLVDWLGADGHGQRTQAGRPERRELSVALFLAIRHEAAQLPWPASYFAITDLARCVDPPRDWKPEDAALLVEARRFAWDPRHAEDKRQSIDFGAEAGPTRLPLLRWVRVASEGAVERLRKRQPPGYPLLEERHGEAIFLMRTSASPEEAAERTGADVNLTAAQGAIPGHAEALRAYLRSEATRKPTATRQKAVGSNRTRPRERSREK